MFNMKFLIGSIALSIVFGISNLSYAQYIDHEIWYGGVIRYDINKQLRVDLEEQFRSNLTAGILRQNFTELGMSYKFNRYFRVRGFFRYTNRYADYGKYRLGLDARARYSKKGNPIALSYRIRLQQTKEIFTKEPESIFRQQFKMEYNLSKLVDPSFGFELFHRFNGYNNIQGLRYTIGLDWRLYKGLELATFLRFDQEKNVSDPVLKVIYGFSLVYDLKLKD